MTDQKFAKYENDFTAFIKVVDLTVKGNMPIAHTIAELGGTSDRRILHLPPNEHEVSKRISELSKRRLDFIFIGHAKLISGSPGTHGQEIDGICVVLYVAGTYRKASFLPVKVGDDGYHEIGKWVHKIVENELN